MQGPRVTHGAHHGLCRGVSRDDLRARDVFIITSSRHKKKP